MCMFKSYPLYLSHPLLPLLFPTFALIKKNLHTIRAGEDVENKCYAGS